MIIANIQLGEQVFVDKEAHVNNVSIGNHTKVAGGARVFGAPAHPLQLGAHSYVGPNTLIEGYNAQVVIGAHVSFAQNIVLISGSGPNASEAMQRVFPLVKAEVHIGDHCWIGANASIMPGVRLGNYCVVAAHSFVNASFPNFSIIGGVPARLIRTFTEQEIKALLAHD